MRPQSCALLIVAFLFPPFFFCFFLFQRCARIFGQVPLHGRLLCFELCWKCARICLQVRADFPEGVDARSASTSFSYASSEAAGTARVGGYNEVLYRYAMKRI